MLLLFVLSTICCISNAQTVTQSQAEAAIQSANELWEQSKRSGHEWTTIKPLVTQANQALDAKNFTQAITFARQAKRQAQLALIQAENEKTNWLLSVPP